MKQKYPKTIQIFLPTGEPTGIRIAEQTTSIMRVIEVPRRDLAQFLTFEEATQVGLYFLVGGENKDEIYIGQSSEVGRRLQQHHKEDKKDWERALILVSLTHNLTQTHVLYLEFLSIESAKKCQRVRVINGNNGQKPHIPIPLQADCEEIHQISALLLATLGYPFFELLHANSLSGDATNQETIFIIPRNKFLAQAIYTNEGMVVLKGSKLNYVTATNTPKYRHVHIEKCDSLIAKGILQKIDNDCIFTQDYLFPSPSAAASLLLLANANGWTEFKTQDGITLRDYQSKVIEIEHHKET